MSNRTWQPFLYGLIFIILIIVFVPFFLPYRPNDIDIDSIWAPPGGTHLLGTDNMGRDIFTRLLHGGRISLFIAFFVEILAFPIGSMLGYFRTGSKSIGFIVFDQLMDVMFSFPTILLAMLLIGIMGVGIWTIIIVIAIVEIPVFYIYTKRLTMQIRKEPFILTLESIGVKPGRIFVDHILPHLLPALLPKIIFNFATTIIFESTLSFIGIGIQAPTASWGNMISAGVPYIRVHPNLVLSASVLFAFTTMMLFGLGEGLNERKPQ